MSVLLERSFPQRMGLLREFVGRLDTRVAVSGTEAVPLQAQEDLNKRYDSLKAAVLPAVLFLGLMMQGVVEKGSEMLQKRNQPWVESSVVCGALHGLNVSTVHRDVRLRFNNIKNVDSSIYVVARNEKEAKLMFVYPQGKDMPEVDVYHELKGVYNPSTPDQIEGYDIAVLAGVGSSKVDYLKAPALTIVSVKPGC